MTGNIMLNRANNYVSRVPQVKMPRSIFPIGFSRKQTQEASYLTPIFYEEVLPGDTWELNVDSFVRLATQLTAPVDNLWVKTYWFFDPYRLEWDNFTKQHGERKNPDDSIDYITPTIEYPEGIPFKSLADYLGDTPCGIEKTKMTVLGHRMYNRIINQYFRSENLQDSLTEITGDSGDTPSDYSLFKIGKARDYFTNALPELQKGDPVTLPLGTTAPVIGNGMALGLMSGSSTTAGLAADAEYNMYANVAAYGGNYGETASGAAAAASKTIGVTTNAEYSGLVADLSNATAATIQAMRMAIESQEILERDNRNGTRYTEQLSGRYGVHNPDLLLYRCQFLGATRTPLFTTPVIQTSGTNITGQATAQGNIAGFGVTSDHGNVIRQSFGEFGAIMGLAVVTAIPQYQNGMGRKWSRLERYDYYYPEFNFIGDQPIHNGEIFYQGEDVTDDDTGETIDEQVWGYTPRYEEYRTFKNQICGELRSNYTQSLDIWHYAENFETLPQLNEDFMQDKTSEILKRTLAITSNNNEGEGEEEEEENPVTQLICEYTFTGAVTRVLPSHAIPRIGGSLL